MKLKYKKYRFYVEFSGCAPLKVECTEPTNVEWKSRYEFCGTLALLRKKADKIIPSRPQRNKPDAYTIFPYPWFEDNASYIAQEISKICAKCPYNKINEKTR